MTRELLFRFSVEGPRQRLAFSVGSSSSFLVLRLLTLYFSLISMLHISI